MNFNQISLTPELFHHEGKYIPKNKSVLQLVKSYERAYGKIFDKAKHDWNLRIREFMRDETGLKLTSRKGTKDTINNTVVDVSIKSDKDDEFMKIIDNTFPDLDFDEFMQLSTFRAVANDTEQYFQKGQNSLSIRRLLNYCTEYFKKYDLIRIIDELFSVQAKSRDIWGTYTYKTHKVEVYYLPIIIFCKLTNISIEHAIAKVMAHELAHAYHHVGKDKDGAQWLSMPGTDKNIIEGLAQYYTLNFVEEFAGHYPLLKEAYKKMVSCQGGPYRIHEEWAKKYKNEHIRFVMILARKKSIKDYEVFFDYLKKIGNTF